MSANELMSVLDEHREELSDGLYLELSNMLMKRKKRAEEQDSEVEALKERVAHLTKWATELRAVAFDAVWTCRGTDRYLQKATKDAFVYKKAGASANADEDDNFSDWACGFWNGVLGTTRMLRCDDPKMFYDDSGESIPLKQAFAQEHAYQEEAWPMLDS